MSVHACLPACLPCLQPAARAAAASHSSGANPGPLLPAPFYFAPAGKCMMATSVACAAGLLLCQRWTAPITIVWVVIKFLTVGRCVWTI